MRDLLELHDALPDSARSKQALLAHIDRRVEQLIRVETTHSRDWGGITLAVTLLLMGSAVVYWTVDQGGWWIAVSVAFGGFLLLLGAVGLGTSVRKRERDARGRATNREKGDARSG